MLATQIESPGHIAVHEVEDKVAALGSMAVLNSFGAALDLITDGAVDTSELVSHRMPLTESCKSLHTVGSGEAIKAHVFPGETEV